MSAKMTMPLSQQRHSNVAVVRVSKGGKRLEVACYKNKVGAFRSGAETRLDEVLQIDRVFTNVSRGAYAGLADIQKVLGADFDEAKAVLHILKHGDLQVAQQEREAETEDLMKDICNIIAEKCVHPATLRPYPPEIIEQALRSVGVTIRQDQPAKKQALQFIHQLVTDQVIPIRRADMKVRCTGDAHALLALATELGATVHDAADDAGVSPNGGAEPGLVLLLEPSHFRALDDAVRKLGGTAQVLETAVMVTGEGGVDELASAATLTAATAAASPHPPRIKPSTTAAAAAAAAAATQKSRGAVPSGASSSAGTHSLEEQLHHIELDDSDSDGAAGKRKGGRRKTDAKKPPKPKASTATVTAPPKAPAPEGSDEELEVNRKSRKKVHAAAAASKPSDDSDEDWKNGLDDDDDDDGTAA